MPNYLTGKPEFVIVLSSVDCRQSTNKQIIESHSDVVKQMTQQPEQLSLKQLKSQSLHEQTLDVIRQAILNGEIKPGQALTETRLASDLGVSRAPVREALRILNTEGLVETVPYHGTTVRSLNKQDIQELYSMRSTLECFAVKQIIAAANPEHIQKLRGLYAEMDKAGQAKDIKLVNNIDRAFHDELISMSNHSLLEAMWQMVAMRVRQVMALTNRRNSDLRQIARNHIPIIDAIEAGDEPEAIALLEQHIASAGSLIVEDWLGEDEIIE